LLQYLARQHRLHIFIRETRCVFACGQYRWTDAVDVDATFPNDDENEEGEDDDDEDMVVLAFVGSEYTNPHGRIEAVPSAVVVALNAQRPQSGFQQCDVLAIRNSLDET
jgi:hypothetical protein